MLASKKVIGMITEATQGAVGTLAATDYFNAFDVEASIEAEFIDQNYVSSSLDAFAKLIGKKWMEVKFKRYLFASGTPGTIVTPLDALLQACGLVKSGTVTCIYSPSSNPVASFYGPGKSATIKIFEDGAASSNGLNKIITGAMGNLKMTFEAGKPAILEADMKGLWNAVVDANVPTNTPAAIAVPIITSATFSVQSYSASISKLEIDLGNEFSEIPDVNAATGILGYQITGRKAKGTMDPQATLVATHDFYGKMVSGALGSVSIVIGSGAGNITTITMPKVQYVKISNAKRNGDLMIFNVELIPSRNTGDDWINIVQS